MNKILNIIFIVVVACFAFFYRVSIENTWVQSFAYYFPCKMPISYSIGSFDTRFGVSKEDFIKAISDAEKVWETPIHKNLFQYETDGRLKVNLVYDTRQESTVKLKNMGLVVQNSKASYDELKAKYDALNHSYKQQKNSFEAEVASFNSRKATYEAEVSAANKRGGADKQTFARLNTEKMALNQEIIKINQDQTSLNSMVDNINALVATLNQLATSLNINVNQLNTVGASLGGEFDEGVYKTDKDGQEIDIYQFDNREKLVRVLAHELGHALGLDHVDDPKAIMYRLNNGFNETPTATDIAQLGKLCGLPPASAGRAQVGIK